MAFLTIAGIEVKVTDFAEDEPILNGDEGRSFDGSLRGDISGEKRRWKGTGLEIAAADYETLRAAVAFGAHVAVGGTAMPGGVTRTCRVRLQGATYVRDGTTGHLVVPGFALEDV